MNETRTSDERLDGLERELAALTSRIASAVFLVRCLAAMLLLTLAGVVSLLCFPDWNPGKLLESRPSASNSQRAFTQAIKQDIYEIERDLKNDMLDMKKELKSDIAGAASVLQGNTRKTGEMLKTLQDDMFELRKQVDSVDGKKLAAPKK